MVRLFALGYSVDPGREDVFSHGAWFSSVCHDQLPFVSQSELNRSDARGARVPRGVRGEPVRGHLPDLAESAGQAVRTCTRRSTSNVPVLIFVGRFDPYGSPPFVRQAARTLSAQLGLRDSRRWLQRPCRQLLRARDAERLDRPPDLAARHDCLRAALPRIKFLLG